VIYSRVFRYCFEVRSGDDCFTQTDRALQKYGDILYACHRQYPTLDTPFKQCLTNEEMDTLFSFGIYIDNKEEDARFTEMWSTNNAIVRILTATTAAQK